MPKYLFKCNKCGKEFEDLVKMDTKTVKCECGAEASKIFSGQGVGFELKGGGWYKGGYSKGSK